MAHPLDPLSAAEIVAACDLVRADLKNHGLEGCSPLFSSVELDVVPKELLYDHEAEEFLKNPVNVPRVAYVTMYVRGGDLPRTFAVRVSLTDNAVARFEELPVGTQANIHISEFLEVEKMVQNDPGFIECMKKRGLTDGSKLMVEPWSAGNFGVKEEHGQRLIRAQVWARDPANNLSDAGLSEIDNGYAHPVSGVVAVCDMNKKTVTIEDLSEEDGGKTVPIPTANFNFFRHKNAATQQRTDIKPIQITQPEGTNFSVTGRLVEWMGWSFRVGFNWREGLTLEQISFAEDSDLPGARRRPIANKVSCCEMVVPYFSADKQHRYKNAFDMGEYGVGFCCNSLALGCDCVGQIHYFDAHLNTMEGGSMDISNAICLHEEDWGLLWKHTDWRLDMQEHPQAAASARSTRLVISTVVTLGNYEYGFFYYFYPDGSFETQLKATGLVNTSALPAGTQPTAGQYLGNGLEAQHHQHCFSFRLDMAVDGIANNSLVETNTYPEEDEAKNPYGNAVVVANTKAVKESDAQRDLYPQTARSWKVVSEKHKNRVGEPTAYKLYPGTATAFCLLRPTSKVLKRATFMKHHIWATPYDPEELFACGRYPNQSNGDGHGLEHWTRNDRKVEDSDLVLWHTVNMHHLVRLEDFPVMPVEMHGFSLKPAGFFDQNPALRMPAKRGGVPDACRSKCNKSS